MTTLLIGERFNMQEREFLYTLWERDSERYIDTMLSFGALVRNRRLRGVGCVPDESMNLLPPAPQDVKWDRHMADEVAKLVRNRLSKYSLVWFCGRRVAAAFRVSHKAEFGDTETRYGTPMQFLPHPSGLNRYWNDHDSTAGLKVDVEQAVRMYCAVRAEVREKEV